MKLPKLPFIKHIRRTVKKRSRSFSLRFNKRQVFVGITLILTLLLVVTQLSRQSVHTVSIVGLAVATYIFSVIALREDLHGIEFLTLGILPTLFTVSVSLFYFLLPPRLLTRLPIVVLYAIGMYAILLTENIYNVAAERTIQLLRAAQSVGFLLTLVTLFFLLEAMLSLHVSPWINALVAAVISFPLILQSLWAMTLTPRITVDVWVGSGIITLLLAQMAAVLSFWPVRTTIGALFLTTVFYSLVGMSQQYLVERLFHKTKIEFLSVLILVFILVFVTTKWGSGNWL